MASLQYVSSNYQFSDEITVIWKLMNWKTLKHVHGAGSVCTVAIPTQQGGTTVSDSETNATKIRYSLKSIEKTKVDNSQHGPPIHIEERFYSLCVEALDVQDKEAILLSNVTFPKMDGNRILPSPAQDTGIWGSVKLFPSQESSSGDKFVVVDQLIPVESWMADDRGWRSQAQKFRTRNFGLLSGQEHLTLCIKSRLVTEAWGSSFPTHFLFLNKSQNK